MEKSLRRVVEKILMLKFPEISSYDLAYVDNANAQVYNLFLTVSEELTFERERELYNEAYTLFSMLGPMDERLKVFIIHDYDDDKFERVVRQY
jgi:hypothetical protein